MATKGHRPAGGIASKNATRPPVRIGAGPKAVSKKYVSQIGASQGNRVQIGLESGDGGKILKGVRADVYRGPGYPTKFGNEVALNVGKGGPGKGRQVYEYGSQHGLADRQNSPKGRPFDQKG